MKKAFFLITVFIVVISGNGCNSKSHVMLSSTDIGKVISQMTQLMIHDVTSPPLAARFFAYTCLAGYEVVSENDKHCKSVHGILNDYPLVEKPKQVTGYDSKLTAVLAMLETAEKLQPSGSLLVLYEKDLLDSCKRIGFNDAVIDSSKKCAQSISKQILAYAKSDKYNRISNYARYTPLGIDGSWYPTPPAYLQPVEPYFNTIRPLTLDSCAQFKPVKPVAFSTNKHSEFYRCMLMNYRASGAALTKEQREIAGFWDCNPFAVENDGHMLIGLKKISPGAHWLGITSIACKKSKISFDKAMEIHMLVAVGLMDSFICCWDEKYRSNRIRPETAVRKYIDPNWKPLLQTPPFPEYLSGHSCISATSSVILSHYFGNGFHYRDNVEEKYGLTPRSFSSFIQAANEAAVSRFYGGIHFKDAIDNGLKQGFKVGEWVLAKFNHQ